MSGTARKMTVWPSVKPWPVIVISSVFASTDSIFKGVVPGGEKTSVMRSASSSTVRPLLFTAISNQRSSSSSKALPEIAGDS
jgi:hypothetical protein